MRRHLLAVSLLFAFLLMNSAFAQQQQPIFGTGGIDIASTLGTILTNYIGIIFIIVFIVILLVIGGVIHMPAGGGSIIVLIIFGILIMLAFVFPNFIAFPDFVTKVPDNFKIWALPGPAVQALTMLGLPAEWGYVPAVIYLFILPFAAIYTLFWAFLTSLGMFHQPNVNRILSLIVAFLTIPVGWFTKMVWALFAFMGGWSVAVFAVMFIAGIFFRGAGIVAKEYSAFRVFADRKKDADRFEDYADRKLSQMADAGISATHINQVRTLKEALVKQIGEGSASYKGAKTQFDQGVSAR